MYNGYRIHIHLISQKMKERELADDQALNIISIASGYILGEATAKE